MKCQFAHWIYADTHRSGIQRSRGRWSDSAFGAGETGNEGKSWRNRRPLQNNDPADVIPAEIPVLTLSASVRGPQRVLVYFRIEGDPLRLSSLDVDGPEISVASI